MGNENRLREISAIDTGRSSWAVSVTFSPDGHKVVAGFLDGSIKLLGESVELVWLGEVVHREHVHFGACGRWINAEPRDGKL